MKTKILEIAEKHYEKLRKVDGSYSIRTVRAIAKDCGVDKDMLCWMTTTNPLVDLYLIDDCWDPYGGSKLEETYAMANFMMKCKERWNKYGK